MISFHANSKVWITEIKERSGAFICTGLGHQYSYPDLFKSPSGLVTGRGHRLVLFLPLPVKGGNIH
jgi:hypothetical protein